MRKRASILYLRLMKTKYLTFIILALFMAACSSSPKEEEKEQAQTESDEVSGTEMMNAYVDTLTQIADSLEMVYNHAISEYTMSPDSISWIEAKYKMTAQTLETKLVDLNNSIHQLLLDKKLTEEEYQNISLDIDMDGVSKAMEKLKLLGIDLSNKVMGPDSASETE